MEVLDPYCPPPSPGELYRTADVIYRNAIAILQVAPVLPVEQALDVFRFWRRGRPEAGACVLVSTGLRSVTVPTLGLG